MRCVCRIQLLPCCAFNTTTSSEQIHYSSERYTLYPVSQPGSCDGIWNRQYISCFPSRAPKGKCWGIRGVLVRLTTCNWLINSLLPKLSLITTAASFVPYSYSAVQDNKWQRTHTQPVYRTECDNPDRCTKLLENNNFALVFFPHPCAMALMGAITPIGAITRIITVPGRNVQQ